MCSPAGENKSQDAVQYESAINQGICLPAAIEELPIKMGKVCAFFAIPNRKPYQPLFDILPIEELISSISTLRIILAISVLIYSCV